MPKVSLMPKAIEQMNMENNLYAWIYGQLAIRKMRQSDLANQIFMSQQTLSNRLSHKNLTATDLIMIFRVFEASEEEIITLLKTKGV